MEREYVVVDAFSTQAFGGNAAAVVLDADGLDDAAMQLVAAEFNLSETTFVLRPSPGAVGVGHGSVARPADVRFRWFTPTAEVRMCGHATIGGVHGMFETGRLNVPDGETNVSLAIETLSGVLTALVERSPGATDGVMIWLDLVDPQLTDHDVDLTELGGALGLAAGAFDEAMRPVATQDRDLIVFVRDASVLNGVRPAFARLQEVLETHQLRGLSVATARTPSPSIHVQSRFFAPTVGIDEDPVTGSVHGPLAAYLVRERRVPTPGGVAALTCAQGRPGGRHGLLYAAVTPKGHGTFGVRIGGRATTTMRGRLTA